jgi:glycosyltransferase involved in cell wall biosynthesis
MLPRRPRILFLDHTASLGGAELALLRLVREVDQSRFDLRVVLFSDGPLVRQLRDAGASVEILPLAESILKTSRHAAGESLLRLGTVWTTLRHIVRLAGFIRRQRIDLVHTNSLKADLIGGLAALLAGRRFIWHVHDRVASDYMPWPVVRAFSFLAHKLPHYLITNSQSTLETLLPYPRTQCDVIYPGVNLADIAVPVEPVLRDPQAGALIGLVGRISPTKGQDIFLRAAAQVLQRFPNVRFQIVGSALFNDSGYETRMRQLASSLNLDGVVEFTGFVTDVEQRIAKLDLLVHASTTPEPFGQVVIEGLAAGKPVVATNAGGIPEIIVHRENGLLVPPGDVADMADAICCLLGEPDLARSLAARGRARVAQLFTIQRTARQVEKVYATLLGLPDGQPEAVPAHGVFEQPAA